MHDIRNIVSQSMIYFLDRSAKYIFVRGVRKLRHVDQVNLKGSARTGEEAGGPVQEVRIATGYGKGKASRPSSHLGDDHPEYSLCESRGR